MALRAVSVSSPTTTRPLAVEPSLAAEELDPAFLQPGQLTGVVEVVDHLVAALEHGLRVEVAADRGADAGHAARLGQQLARSQQRLRGHAGVVGALAADQVALDDRDREPAVGEAAGADLARGAGADHDRVEFSLRLIRDTVQSEAHSTGATGFDLVDPCERLQVEVAGGLVKHRHQPIRADHEFALAA